MQVTNKERQIHLYKQRKIQIKNNGIKAVFHGRNQNSSCPYLEIDYQYMYIVEEWLYNKIMVNIYNISNYRQVYILDKKCLYIVNNCIYITSHEIEDVLQDNCHYRLAKNNATIQLLSKALNNTDSVDNSILEFINNQNVTNIQSNLLFNSQPWMFQGLNQSQCKAMDLVIRQKIAFIKGPPGCGKTKTIARLALIFSYYSYPMLIGGVTNIANMTILNALLKECYIFNYLPNILLYISKQLSSQNALHTPQIRPFTFRYKIIQNYLILSQQNNMTRQSIEQLLDHFYSDGQMSSSFLSIYYQAMAKIFSQTQILIITTTSSVKMDIKLSNNQRFHPFIGILDEAAQASWADTYCYLVKGVHKMVFIGDDKQLTPTVISQNQILKETMFTKLFMKNPKYYILLNEQYRMHPKISQFPNIYFYQNQLKDGVSASERISQIPYFTTYPFSFINCNMEEMQVIDEHSGKKKYCNMGQIQIVKKILQYFPIEELSNIGIISPYDLQIKQICKQMGDWMLYYGLTVRTCDGYQGCEKDYIIVSCVRSNKFGKIGFCNEENRLNVTLTRARKGIIVIGNAQTFKNYSIPEITSQKQKNGQKDSQKQQEQQDQQKQQKYSQQQQKQKVQQKDKHVWKSYFEYLQQKQLILNVDKLQQYPISKNNYIHHYEQYIQNLNKQYEQLQTSEKQTNRQNSQQEQQKKQQQKIETVLIKNNIEDEEELENKIYKEYKKKIKYFMNQIRRIIKIQARLQQKQVQIANIRSQLYHTLSNTNYSIKKKEDKILIIQVSRIYNKIIYLTLTQYEKYQEFKTTSPSKSKKIEQNNFKGEDLLKQKTNQLTSKIIIQMQGQYNHYKENLLILQCIQINIIWSLEKYPCKQPQIIQQSKENIKKQKTQQKSSKK